MLVVGPLHGHIAHFVFCSAPRTPLTRYVSSSTSVSVLSALVSSATSVVAASSRGTPSWPTWPRTSFVMLCSLFPAGTPLFSAISRILLSARFLASSYGSAVAPLLAFLHVVVSHQCSLASCQDSSSSSSYSHHPTVIVGHLLWLLRMHACFLALHRP